VLELLRELPISQEVLLYKESWGVLGLFIGGEEDLHQKLEAVWSTWTASQPYMWPASQPSRPSLTSGVTDPHHQPPLTRVSNSFQKYAKPWPAT
jgi:hypothetical protein